MKFIKVLFNLLIVVFVFGFKIIKKVVVVSYKVFKWILIEFLGLRYVWRKVKPLKDNEKDGDIRPPATIGLWLIGIYFALFGVASQRYENRLDKAETYEARVLSQIAIEGTRDVALKSIAELGRQKVPIKPSLGNPVSIVKSLFVDRIYEEGKKAVKPIVESFKDSLPEGMDLKECNLHEANLSRADLRYADLRYVELSEADLSDANLTEANLSHANLSYTDLNGADLHKAKLIGANLIRADLINTNLFSTNLIGINLDYANLIDAILVDANLSSANFNCTDLGGADLRNANLRKTNISFEQLKTVKSLYKTKLDSTLLIKALKECPKKLATIWHNKQLKFIIDSTLLDSILNANKTILQN